MHAFYSCLPVSPFEHIIYFIQ